MLYCIVVCRSFRPALGRSSRLTSATTTAPAVPFAYVEKFCRIFNPEEARHAPERGT